MSSASGFTAGAPSPAVTTMKVTDSKGRVVLGGGFANKTVIVEQLNDTEIIVKLARLIPEQEAWLYENPAALNAVRMGLAQARARELTKGPDLTADSRMIGQLED